MYFKIILRTSDAKKNPITVLSTYYPVNVDNFDKSLTNAKRHADRLAKELKGVEVIEIELLASKSFQERKGYTPSPNTVTLKDLVSGDVFGRVRWEDRMSFLDFESNSSSRAYPKVLKKYQ